MKIMCVWNNIKDQRDEAQRTKVTKPRLVQRLGPDSANGRVKTPSKLIKSCQRSIEHGRNIIEPYRNAIKPCRDFIKALLNDIESPYHATRRPVTTTIFTVTSTRDHLQERLSLREIVSKRNTIHKMPPTKNECLHKPINS